MGKKNLSVKIRIVNFAIKCSLAIIIIYNIVSIERTIVRLHYTVIMKDKLRDFTGAAAEYYFNDQTLNLYK